ncbi:hypothetical protein STENM327S_04750 [Streptomyces tendae]
MGALTEAYANQPAPYDTPDYTVGEEIGLQGRGPIRNMYNPRLVNNDPTCYSASIPNTEEHAAAGPMNHWFYLLAEGSAPGGGKPSSPTCDGSQVTGIGIQNAGKIFYGGMLLKTSGMTYKRYRTATLTAAKNLDASCRPVRRHQGGLERDRHPRPERRADLHPAGDRLLAGPESRRAATSRPDPR